MSQFDKLFIEEANEQLEIAEQALLNYETNAAPALIEEAFRALHTFKGAAYIFSLKELGDFAHHIESILDGVRQGSLSSIDEIIGKLLVYLDHLKRLMSDPEINNENERLKHDKISAEINILSKEIANEVKNFEQKNCNSTIQEIEDDCCTFYLSIIPKIKLSESSNHPIFNIIEEITELGSSQNNPHFITEENEEAQIIQHWDIYVACPQSAEDLEDLFMFIDSDVDLGINKIADSNLFEKEEFEPFLESIKGFSPAEKINELNAFGNSIQHTEIEVTEEINTPDPVINPNLKSSSIRVNTNKIDQLMNLVSELVTDQASLSLFAEKYHIPELENLVENMDRHIIQLRDITFDMTLVPIESMMGRLRRLVRDSSKALGKEVEFIVDGGNTELDKIFIDSLTDPLMHILRNSIDHGIECPEVRKEAGKPEKGTIRFEAYYSGANVHIDISDDGKGLDTEVIWEKAVQKGIVDKNRNLSTKEMMELIFEPGFSTAKNITDVSGRGVGMDVVRKNITELKGEIELNSEKGKGTKITIKVPLTLSIIDGLLVKIAEEFFVIPIQVVKKCYEVPYGKLLHNFNDILILDDRQIPFINLREELALNGNPPPEYTIAITVLNRNKEVAITADEIIGEYQAVLKPIGQHYKDQDFISGATILGDGTVALVLDTNKLVELKSKLPLNS
ncbi:chemotaxis protein CheA [Flexithrix dorotheae]|uniref:chemotaxis protein CheA n=1 Tax=Flexithrix dorotheae TaxID=70993 RepID=UPI00036FB6A8|nr:chemotaxis protein CheA [Flexithrix dorotheae]